MVNWGEPIAAEYVVRGVLTLPKVSANFGFASFKRGVSLPISSEVTTLFREIASAVSHDVRRENVQAPLHRARFVQ